MIKGKDLFSIGRFAGILRRAQKNRKGRWRGWIALWTREKTPGGFCRNFIFEKRECRSGADEAEGGAVGHSAGAGGLNCGGPGLKK
ncbi:hypothetical protein SDC9_68640 [bioreactor metagenome]|uniref:Uncharacterized protein n=1 Tax=bioreactor metagenome TaxID=1076179 RepID=A0A644Y1G4_9ZZZZ